VAKLRQPIYTWIFPNLNHLVEFYHNHPIIGEYLEKTLASLDIDSKQVKSKEIKLETMLHPYDFINLFVQQIDDNCEFILFYDPHCKEYHLSLLDSKKCKLAKFLNEIKSKLISSLFN